MSGRMICTHCLETWFVEDISEKESALDFINWLNRHQKHKLGWERD